MVVGKLAHRPCETGIPLRPVLGFQEGISSSQRRHLGQPQQLDEAVLIGEEAAFDAPLGLRRVSRNSTDAQLAQGSPHLLQTILLNAFRLAFFRARWNRKYPTLAH